MTILYNNFTETLAGQVHLRRERSDGNVERVVLSCPPHSVPEVQLSFKVSRAHPEEQPRGHDKGTRSLCDTSAAILLNTANLYKTKYSRPKLGLGNVRVVNRHYLHPTTADETRTCSRPSESST